MLCHVLLQVTMPSVLTVVDLYRNRLKVYGHLGLPRFHTSNSFQHRIDMALITLVRECPNLHTLVNSFHLDGFLYEWTFVLNI